MIVNAIYHEQNQVHRVYHGNQLIFQCSNPNTKWEYPVVENGVLKIRQAHTATMKDTTLEVR